MEGTCTGPWSKGTAVADALTRTDAEVLVIADADVWVPSIPQAVEAVASGQPWVVPHRYVHRLDRRSTEAVLTIKPTCTPNKLTQPPYQGVIGGGVTVLRREVYEDCPLDPRFLGWGQEDESWGLALRTLHGEPMRFDAKLYHHWHLPQERLDRRTGSLEGRALWRRYGAAFGKPDAMRALIAEYR